MPSDRPILHVVPAGPWGGLQALVPTLAREQDRQGKDVRLICLGSGQQIRELAANYGLGEKTQSVAGAFAPVRLFFSLRKVRGAIVHSHCEPLWAGAIIALSCRGRWIEHAHVYSDGPGSWKARLARGLQKVFASRHIAISNSVGRALVASGITTPAKLDVVLNGVPLDGTTCRCQVKTEFTLGFVGRVVEEKGIFDFIDLAQKLDGDEAFHFAVYGDGAELAAARTYAAECGLTDRVVFHGHVAEISEAWNLIDAAVIFSHREPFGLVFLEATLHDVPTISYANDSGGSEVAAMLRSAHRVAPRDFDAVIKIVRALASDREATRADLEKDRETIAKRFDIAAMARGIDAAYQKLNRTRARASPRARVR